MASHSLVGGEGGDNPSDPGGASKPYVFTKPFHRFIFLRKINKYFCWRSEVMLSKTRSPKQQALGTAPAEGSRRAFSEGRQHTPLPTSCIGKEPAGPRSFEKDWSQGWQGNGTALCSKPSQLTKGEMREGKGSLAESSGGGRGEGGDAEFSSITEWWPVCFGKLHEGVERGWELPGAPKEAFSSK